MHAFNSSVDQFSSFCLTQFQHIISHQRGQPCIPEHHRADGVSWTGDGEASLGHFIPEPENQNNKTVNNRKEEELWHRRDLRTTTLAQKDLLPYCISLSMLSVIIIRGISSNINLKAIKQGITFEFMLLMTWKMWLITFLIHYEFLYGLPNSSWHGLIDTVKLLYWLH